VAKYIICLFVLISVMAPAEASEDFYNPFVPDSHTRGLWHFNQNSGDTVALDTGRWDNHGLLSAATINTIDPNKTWVAGMSGFGNCARTYWNSSTDYNYGRIEVPQSSDNNSLTIGHFFQDLPQKTLRL